MRVLRHRRRAVTALGTQRSGGRITERGASLVEYAMLIALIVLVAVVAMELVGTNLADRFREFAGMLTR